MTFKNKTDIAWAAGLFEGEGCISYGERPSRRLMLRLCSTDEDVVQRFREIVGVGSIYGPVSRTNKRHKPYWVYNTTSFEDSQYLLCLFWQWLGKRRKAKAISALRGYVANKREARRAFKAPRLSDAAISEIVARSATGEHQKDIARDFGITQSGVCRVMQRVA
jgi:hypothetical protein